MKYHIDDLFHIMLVWLVPYNVSHKFNTTLRTLSARWQLHARAYWCTLGNLYDRPLSAWVLTLALGSLTSAWMQTLHTVQCVHWHINLVEVVGIDMRQCMDASYKREARSAYYIRRAWSVPEARCFIARYRSDDLFYNLQHNTWH